VLIVAARNCSFGIRAKFRELAGVVLTPEGVSRVEAAVERCEDWQSVDELTGLLDRHGRP